MSVNNEEFQLSVAQAAVRMKENLPALLEMIRMRAILTRHRYLSLVASGFKEEEALKLSEKIDM